MTETATAAQLNVGDRITEIDTPDGPYYTVLKVNAASIVVDAAEAGEEPLPVRIPTTPGATLLRVTA